MARTTEVKPSSDAWIDEQFPGKRHGNTTRLRLCGDSAGGKRRRAVIFFARPFPLGASVVSAKLHLHAKEAWGGSHDVKVLRVAEKWGEKGVNWNNQPATGGSTVTKTVTGLSADEEFEVDVTSIYEDVTAGSKQHGLRIALADGDTSKHAVYSSEHPKHRLRPWLEVIWAERPEGPRDGAPAGNNAVGTDQPVLDYRFGVKGRDPAQKQSAKQVQISTSADFSSPVYDSGKVLDDRTLFDLDGTAFSATAGVSYYWRVRAWDDDDLVSDWSDKWQFRYVAKGSLALNSPAAGSPSTVHDLTPPVTWLLSGATQAQFEVTLFIQRQDGTWKRKWELHRHKGTDTSVNVPKGIIKRNRTFLVRVRVWDDEDRQSVPNDPKYYEVTRQFVYTRDGTPAKVTNLVVTNFASGLAVTWDDATEPDYYCITVNDEEQLDRIEPADVLVSAGSPSHYAYIYWRGEHGVPQTIEVERVVNSGGNLLHSGGGPTAVGTPDVRGKWLVDEDPESVLGMQIIGAEQSDFELGQSGETFNPLNSKRPVRRLDSQRGFEGGVSGTLISTQTALNFQELIGRNKELRYIVQHLNIPVRLGQPSLSPKADAVTFDGWTMGVDLFQVREFFDVVGMDDADDD